MEEPRFGMTIGDRAIKDALKRAVFLEERALDSVWVADHLVGFVNEAMFDGWIFLALFAEHTKRVKIGTCVTDPHRRPPAITAQTVTTIDNIAKGRFILGLGAGEAENLAPFGIAWNKPVSRMREHVEVLTKLWTEELVNYEGEFYHYKDAMGFAKGITVSGINFPLTQKPHPPIWIGANSPKTRELTAELADGWLPYAFSPEEYKENLEQIQRRAKDIGRDADDIESGIWMPVGIAKEHETALERFATSLKFLAALMPNHLRRHGYPEYAKDEFSITRWIRTPHTLKAILETAGKIPDELVEKHFVLGSPDEVIGGIEKFLEVGAQHVVFSCLGKLESRDEGERLIAEKVVPYFKQ